MCRVARRHTRKHRISNIELLQRLQLPSIDTDIAKRQLRWNGHAARVDWTRLPRKVMSCWVIAKRPKGAPQPNTHMVDLYVKR